MTKDQSLPASRIAGLGAYVPPRVVENSVFEKRFGMPAGSIARKTGLESRRHAEPGETPTSMGARAIEGALSAAGFAAGDIDMVISAGTSRDQSIPPDSMIYANLLGVHEIHCLHVEAVCLSFLNALEIADLYLRTGHYQRILIVASEMTSRIIDYDDESSSMLLGDGAAAAVLEVCHGASRIEASSFLTEAGGRNIGVATLLAGGLKLMPGDSGFGDTSTKFHVDGPLELKLAVKHMPRFLKSLLEDAGCRLSEIDHIIPHQVLPRMVGTVLRTLGVASDRVHLRRDFGNQAAASIPVVMSHLVAEGVIRRGERVLLIGGAAGFSLGGIVLVY